MIEPWWSGDGVDIYVGDTLHVLAQLPAHVAQCAVTSPPYFGLRRYQGEPVVRDGDPACEHVWNAERFYVNAGGAAVESGKAWAQPGAENAARVKAARWQSEDTCTLCGAWRGQIGLERTPDLYVDHLSEMLDGLRQVLRADATLWLNLGDSRSGSGPNRQTGDAMGPGGRAQRNGDGLDSRGRYWAGVPKKSMLLVPARAALAMMARGWAVRDCIAWTKPQPMPESVKDRLTSSYEFVFLLAAQRRYYFDWQALAEPAVSQRPSGNGYGHDANISRNGRGNDTPWLPVDWRNGRNVWSIATVPGPGGEAGHAAVFPPELARRCIVAGSRVGDTVIDPFGGSGTTAAVARYLGRRCILVERSEAYARQALERLRQPVLLPATAAEFLGTLQNALQPALLDEAIA